MRAGWFLTCHPAAYRGAYHCQVNDPEQVAEFDGFINNTSEGMIFFDIGAHFGLFSLAALHYGGKQARVIAVDPSPVAVRFLKIQAALNEVADRLRIVQASVAAHTGHQNMVAVGVLASGFYVAPGHEHSASETIRTNAITLDSLAAELKLSPTHIKIDVEGSEASVLRGAEKLLKQPSAPTLFIELHNEIVSRSGNSPRETLTLLRGFGYETFGVDGRVIDDDAILEKPLIRIIARKNDPDLSLSESSHDSALARFDSA
jgi:FkbM family methyltransferase